jgi:hypothetical protein
LCRVGEWPGAEKKAEFICLFMGEEMERLEKVLRKMRLEWPEILTKTYRPAKAVERMLSNESTRETFEAIEARLDKGMEFLVDENIGHIKKSIDVYHQMQGDVRTAMETIDKSIKKADAILEIVERQQAGSTERLVEESEAEEREKKARDMRRGLSFRELSVDDLAAGRIEEINRNLGKVQSENVRKEIRRRAESSIKRRKKEIEARIMKYLEEGKELSRRTVSAYRQIGCSVSRLLSEKIGEVAKKVATLEIMEAQEKREKHKKTEGALFSQMMGRILKQMESLFERIGFVCRKAGPGEVETVHVDEYDEGLFAEIVLGERTGEEVKIELRKEEDVDMGEVVHRISLVVQELLGAYSERWTKEDRKYNIRNEHRTERTAQMYEDMFVRKYQIEVYREHGERHWASREISETLPIIFTSSEEIILCTRKHAKTYVRVAAAALERLGGDTHFCREDFASLSQVGIGRCFVERKQRIEALLREMSGEVREHGSLRGLAKYNAKFKEVVASVVEFDSVVCGGVEEEYIEDISGILAGLSKSLEEAARKVLGVESVEENKYFDYIEVNRKSLISEKLSREIESKNRYSPGAGKSLFQGAGEEGWAAAADLILNIESSHYLAEMIMNKNKAVVFYKGTADIEKKLAGLKQRAWGCTVFHILEFVRDALSDMVEKKGVSRREIFHFLDEDNFVVANTICTIKQYVCTFFLANLDRVAGLVGKDAFSYATSQIEKRIGEVIRGVYGEKEVFYDSTYPVGLFLDLLEAQRRRDVLFLEIMEKKYREDPVVSGAIGRLLKSK